jgi:hypothetical protein
LDEQMTDNTPANDAVERASRIIAQALMEAEVIVAADRDSRATAVSPQLLDALERFSDVLGKLVEYNEAMGARINELTDALNTLADSQARAAAEAAAKPQLPALEPSFAPGGEGIDVSIANVPGFQGLMDMQRALVRLPQVSSAAVRRYQDDEAAIQLVLAQPMTATAIAEGVSASIDQQITVDEARPEGLRLRLRFLS